MRGIYNIVIFFFIKHLVHSHCDKKLYVHKVLVSWYIFLYTRVY